jgi:hypothetical protein
VLEVVIVKLAWPHAAPLGSLSGVPSTILYRTDPDWPTNANLKYLYKSLMVVHSTIHEPFNSDVEYGGGLIGKGVIICLGARRVLLASPPMFIAPM